MKNMSAGVSIVEVLVALLLFSLMIVGFFYMSSANVSIFKRSDDRSQIVTYSQDIIERVKIAWSDPVKFDSRAAVAVPVPPAADYTVDPLKIEFLAPNGTVVTNGPYFTKPVLYKVTLTVKYKSAVYYQIAVRIGHPVPPTT